jgi:hypothetical protein
VVQLDRASRDLERHRELFSEPPVGRDGDDSPEEHCCES